MEKWLNFKFDECPDNETGYDRKNFLKFKRDFKKNIMKQLGEGYSIEMSDNKYDFHGFIKYEDSYMYFSIDDVRYGDNAWYHCILIRSAKHNKDYIGGSNSYVHLDDFGREIKRYFFFCHNFQ